MPHVMRARVALAAVAIAATVFSGDPLAYVAGGSTWNQAQMPYYINSANLDLAGVSAETAIRSGADAWQQQSAAFRFAYSGLSSQTTTGTTESISCCFGTRRAARRSPRLTGGPAARRSLMRISCSGTQRTDFSLVQAAALAASTSKTLPRTSSATRSDSATRYPRTRPCIPRSRIATWQTGRWMRTTSQA